MFCKKIQNEKGYSIAWIRSGHGGEFENHAFETFCNNFSIVQQFSLPMTAQQNGVVERKNRLIQEMGKTVLNKKFCLSIFGPKPLTPLVMFYILC